MRGNIGPFLLALLCLIALTGLGPVFSQDPDGAPGPPSTPQWLDSPSGAGSGDAGDPLSGKYARLAWDPPATGAPVATYIVQVLEMGGANRDTTIYSDITETFKDAWVRFGMTYKARVAGVDAQGLQGPWSPWTPLYSPEMEIGDLEPQGSRN
jgi:hypothetical protein